MDALINRLVVANGTDQIQLGIVDLRSMMIQSLEKLLQDLAEAARRNLSVTELVVHVDTDLFKCVSVAPIINTLLRCLPRVVALHVSFFNTTIAFADVWVNAVDMSAFIGKCLDDATHLTSISLRVLDISQMCGTFDWSVYTQLKGLQSIFVQTTNSCILSMPRIARALSGLNRLERVTISGIPLEARTSEASDADDFHVVRDFFRSPSLETLCLNAAGISPENFWIFQGLEDSTIKHLRLSSCFGLHKQSDSVFASIVGCKELRSLQLSNLTVSDGEARTLSLFLTQPSCVLEKLELSSCAVSHSGIGVLLSSLTTSTTIRDVEIFRYGERKRARCHDTMLADIENGLEALADVPLRSLHLSDWHACTMSMGRGRALAQRLARSYSLEDIRIDYLDTESQSLLDSIGRLNKAGRRYLGTCRSRKAGIELLGQVSSDLNDVFTHLCENPSLCVL